MSYQIIYNSDKIRVLNTKRKSYCRKLIVCALAIALLWLLRITGHTAELWSSLIPGDPAITISAFERMTNALKEGQGISESVFVFCETVIEGAKIG